MPRYDYDDQGYWASGFRELRHTSCFMAPLSVAMFLVFGLFLLITLLIQAPVLLLGLLLSPILSRTPWYIEFLYPWGIARWAHFFLISHSSRQRHRDEDKNRGFHSRTIEQKFEVVKGRVYIHPLPQLLDNLGYLVVCLPPPKTEEGSNVRITVQDNKNPILALVVDCGDAQATLKLVDLIQEYHYPNQIIKIHSICSTHKHHDHTGGNRELLSTKDTIEYVYGGAVERVPQCNHPLANGDKLDLPKFNDNGMGDLVEIEVAAVPAHTRGSVVYILRSKSQESGATEYLFTGDTMFSAGGGVPFEADVGTESESQINRSNGNTFVRAGLGAAAMERCFAEILARPLPNVTGEDVGERILIFPGHEYTTELLSRQFQATMADSCKWKHFPPKDFFETVSQLYISLHRRSLPHNSGKLLAIPSPLGREIIISPHFRTMKRNAELVVRAVVFWHNNFCKSKIPEVAIYQNGSGIHSIKQRTRNSSKTPSTPSMWNVDTHDVNRNVFTTVYTADLESIIEDLTAGKIQKNEAVKKLHDMQTKLDTPVINRRPIPGYLPTDKSIYKGVSALALLGSPPCAMTLSDSRKMNLPPPIDSNSDRIRVSMKRLLLVLERLGALDPVSGGHKIAAMIRQLWTEAREYTHGANDPNNSDAEAGSTDELELGVLKWILYGVPANQPSWFAPFCMPCSKIGPINTYPSNHPASEMRKRSGDLVAHDVFSCLLCRDAAGCPLGTTEDETRPVISMQETGSDDSLHDDHGVEMEEMASLFLLKEHD
jgi:glyoxylase-like metal-dependent hydrolase (beta-lactamase superfamily II)